MARAILLETKNPENSSRKRWTDGSDSRRERYIPCRTRTTGEFGGGRLKYSIDKGVSVKDTPWCRPTTHRSMLDRRPETKPRNNRAFLERFTSGDVTTMSNTEQINPPTHPPPAPRKKGVKRPFPRPPILCRRLLSGRVSQI